MPPPLWYIVVRFYNSSSNAMVCRRLLFPFLIFLGLNAGSRLAAQEADATSPLGFRTLFPRVGVEGGIDLTKQEGTYAVGCGQFSEGSQTNISVAIAWDKPIGETLRLEGLVGYRQRKVTGSYQTTEPSFIRTADGFVETDVVYNNVGEARFSYLFVQPSIRYYPFGPVYIGVGVNAGLNVGARSLYTKEIVTKAVTLENGELIEAFYPADESSDPHSKVFPEEDLKNSAALLLDPVAFAGFEFRLGRDFFLSPRITYGLPLMKAVSDPELKLSSTQITLGIRYNLR